MIRSSNAYSQDGLTSIHNHDFQNDHDFQKAYQRGVKATQIDFEWSWRVHIGLWSAYTASNLEGDFVECGVAKGFLSSAIMKYLDWDTLSPTKTFHLLDTWGGVVENYLSQEEIETKGHAKHQNQKHFENGIYTKDLQAVKDNFSEWKNVNIVDGPIPETLEKVPSASVAWLHIDMNCVKPEVDALEFFWGKLVPGGIVLLDDYAYITHDLQKDAMDKVAKSRGHQIVSLPTGQGLLIKAN